MREQRCSSVGVIEPRTVSSDDIHTQKTQKVNFLSLNVCGLSSKIQNDDFVQSIKNYDVLCFQETKTDEVDDTPLNSFFSEIGFDYFSLHRKSVTEYRSGGLVFCVKKWLRNTYTELGHSGPYAQLYLFRAGTLMDSQVILANVYVPPETSSYSTIAIFDDIESELLHKVNTDDTEFLIMGDFNAYTSNLPDFDEVTDETGPNINVRYYINGENGTIPPRCSQDKHRPNNYGRRLLQLCKNFNLFIVNGRYGVDKGVGACTCKLGSVVDYVIASRFVLPKVATFEVDAYDAIFSDVHSCISLSLFHTSLNNDGEASVTRPDSADDTSSDKDPRILFVWDDHKVNEFRNNIDLAKIGSLCTKLDNDAEVDVNYVAKTISEIFIGASKGVLREKGKKRNGRGKEARSKPWFTVECKNQQRRYRRAKSNYKFTRSQIDLENFQAQSKNYKRCIYSAKKRYQREMDRKLRTARTQDPKFFWKTLNCKSKPSGSPESSPTVSDFFEHFKGLNTVEQNFNDDFPPLPNVNNDILDAAITCDEINKAAKRIKLGKACGEDSISNEFLKHSLDMFMPVYVRLFNKILDSGIVPETWLNGIIVPIFKNKGSRNESRNYRGLTILSCLGKLFTAIVNDRLNSFCEENDIVSLNQAGFRKGFSTLDHLFVFSSIAELYLHRYKRKLYCLMVDYRQAFDTICRAALWRKLIQSGITGKCFTVIKNMYQNIRSQVLQNGNLSRVFESEVGVRQGENLSPLLFALYVNDLEDFLERSGAQPLNLQCNIDEIEGMLKLLVLLYADDTVIFADSVRNLQTCIDALSNYCGMWKLSVNAEKTKVLIFSKRRPRNLNFMFEDKVLEIVDFFKYLGVTFQRNGTFKEHIRLISNQARKAMFSLLRKGRELSLSVDIMLQLFHTNVEPILLYGCEIWGYENLASIEAFHLKFLKMILKVKQSTPSCMIYGELGEYPLRVAVETRMISFWAKILSGRNDKITYLTYRCLLSEFRRDSYRSKWLCKIKSILDNCGFSDLWLDQLRTVPNADWIKMTVKRRLCDQFVQGWSQEIFTSPKCLNYRVFKRSFEFEKYLVDLPQRLRIPLCKFRLGNHKLPIEVGRYIGIPRAERLCVFCNANAIGHEYHLLLECSAIDDIRRKHIPRYFTTGPNTLKFEQLWQQRKASIAKMLLDCKRMFPIM